MPEVTFSNKSREFSTKEGKFERILLTWFGIRDKLCFKGRSYAGVRPQNGCVAGGGEVEKGTKLGNVTYKSQRTLLRTGPFALPCEGEGVGPCRGLLLGLSKLYRPSPGAHGKRWRQLHTCKHAGMPREGTQRKNTWRAFSRKYQHLRLRLGWQLHQAKTSPSSQPPLQPFRTKHEDHLLIFLYLTFGSKHTWK